MRGIECDDTDDYRYEVREWFRRLSGGFTIAKWAATLEHMIRMRDESEMISVM